MKIFVTGGSGNIGQCVLAELARRNHQVIALVRKQVPSFPGLRPVFGSLSEIARLAPEISDADAIIHLASPRSNERATVLSEDIEGTGRLLDAWTKGPFIFASSQSIYGVPRGVLVEDAPTYADRWYDLAKLTNEVQLSIAVRKQQPGTGISLRVPLLFGASPRRRDRQFLPMVFDALQSGQRFFFNSEQALEACGSVYIGEEDIGRAFADALSITESGPYNFCSGFCTWRELLDVLGKYAGRQPQYAIHAEPPAAGEFRFWQSRSLYDTTKFAKATGFAPRQSLEEVVERFVRVERSSQARGSI